MIPRDYKTNILINKLNLRSGVGIPVQKVTEETSNHNLAYWLIYQ